VLRLPSTFAVASAASCAWVIRRVRSLEEEYRLRFAAACVCVQVLACVCECVCECVCICAGHDRRACVGVAGPGCRRACALKIYVCQQAQHVITQIKTYYPVRVPVQAQVCQVLTLWSMVRTARSRQPGAGRVQRTSYVD
jgi:hypothetical protein